MTRAEQNLYIDREAPKLVRDEVHYQMYYVEDDRLGSNGPYDEVDGLDDTMDRCVDNGDAPILLAECRRIAIALGWYVPVTEKELENTVCTGKPYDFKLDKVKYKWEGIPA